MILLHRLTAPPACPPQDRAARFASMVASFCERLGWYDLEALIAKFQVGEGARRCGVGRDGAEHCR